MKDFNELYTCIEKQYSELNKRYNFLEIDEYSNAVPPILLSKTNNEIKLEIDCRSSNQSGQ